MRPRSLAVLVPLVLVLTLAAPVAAGPIQVYGAWHAGNDYCTWATERDTVEFDAKNRWLIDRGDGRPSVNLVVLSFVHPLRLLERTTDAGTLDGVPRGMTPAIVSYFTSRGIRVQLSMGGITYVAPWEEALAADATGLGLAAAEVASELGVGFEIDYEGDSDAAIDSLGAFIAAYRSVHPHDPSGANPAARLTLDFAAGNRWLIALSRKATTEWLDTANPVLDYANAMVPARQPTATGAIENWQEHLDGKAQYAPPIPPLAPCKFTAGLYLTGRDVTPECDDFYGSVQYATRTFVTTAAPNGAGTTPGLLGYMFWAAECPGTRSACTVPPEGCANGLGVGAQFFDVPIPMLPLRQDAATVDVPAPVIPPGFAFGPARPNPARGAVSFDLELAAPATVTLAIHDVRGRAVATPVRSAYDAGAHRLHFDGNAAGGGPLAPGVYFARLTCNAAGRAFRETRVLHVR